MEKDKWYKVTSGEHKLTTCWYAKFDSIRSNKAMSTSCRIDNTKKFFDNNINFGKEGDYTFSEIDLAEIREFLPKGHPDLIYEKSDYDIF